LSSWRAAPQLVEVPGSIPGRVLGNFSSNVILLSAFGGTEVHSACNRRGVQIIIGMYGLSGNMNTSSVNVFVTAISSSIAEAST